VQFLVCHNVINLTSYDMLLLTRCGRWYLPTHRWGLILCVPATWMVRHPLQDRLASLQM
jgi:hypothetical protein